MLENVSANRKPYCTGFNGITGGLQDFILRFAFWSASNYDWSGQLSVTVLKESMLPVKLVLIISAPNSAPILAA
jgi:hypothetical protein